MAVIDFLMKVWDYIQNNLASAIVVLLVGAILSYLLGRIVRRVLKEIEIDNIAYNAFGLRLKLEKRISKFITYILYIITVFIALTKLLIGYYILIAALTVIGVLLLITLLLKVIDFVPDFVSGIIIKKGGYLKEGKTVIFKNLKATVKRVTMTSTILQIKDKDHIFVPNRTIRKYLG